MSEDRPQESYYEEGSAPGGGERSAQGGGERPAPGGVSGGASAGAPGGAPGGQGSREAFQGDRMAFDPHWKSPGRAALLSVIPGGGQLYIGYYVRGFVIAGGVLLFFALAESTRSLEPVGVLGGLFTWFFGIIDAGRMAALYNHAAAGGKKLELPEDLPMPGLGGSVIAGVALVVFSGIALSNTLFGYSLRWLDDWWPIFPLALGAYLLVRGVMDRLNERPPARPDREPAPATE